MAPVAAFKGVDALDRIYILGSQLSGNIRDALTQASFDMSIDAVAQLSLEFSDPGWQILKTGLLSQGMNVQYEDFNLQIVSLETGEVQGSEGFTLKCRPNSVRLLKNLRGARVMANVSASQFVQAECNLVGLPSVVQPGARRSQVARDLPQPGQTYTQGDYPSAWTTFDRLANEEGYICFEAADIIYFGQPLWLLLNAFPNIVQAYYRIGTVDDYLIQNVPQCTRSADTPDQTTLSFELPGNVVSSARPGMRLNFQGVPVFAAQYMISGVSLNLGDPSANLQIDALTPINPVPHPASTNSTSGSSSSGSGSTRTNTKSSLDFVAWAVKQIGDRYVFGAKVDIGNPNPTQFDCSALVEWAAGRVGINLPRTSEQQIAFCQSHGTVISVSAAINTRGALLWHPGHIAISLGNGKTVEAANSRVGVIQGNAAGRFAKGARVPGMSY